MTLDSDVRDGGPLARLAVNVAPLPGGGGIGPRNGGRFVQVGYGNAIAAVNYSPGGNDPDGTAFITGTAAGITNIGGTFVSAQVVSGCKRVVPYGTPAGARVYFIGGATQYYVTVATGVFTVSAAPTGEAAAVTPWDLRLMTATGSRVRFSETGDPESWPSTYYQDLTPGDGDAISVAAAFDRELYVLKRRRAFVFYGVQKDAVGAPVFQYRTVELAPWAEGPGKLQYAGATYSPVVVGPDGVYYANNGGVWRINSQGVEEISAPIRALFRGLDFAMKGAALPNTGIALGAAPWTVSSLAWADGSLWASVWVNNAASRIVLEWEPQSGWWLHESGCSTAVACVTAAGGGSGIVNSMWLDTAGRAMLLDPTLTNDQDGPDPLNPVNRSFASQWLGGLEMVGGGEEVAIRRASIEGFGSVSYGRDQVRPAGAGPATYAMGGSGAAGLGRAFVNQAWRGWARAHRLAGVTAGWGVTRIIEWPGSVRRGARSGAET